MSNILIVDDHEENLYFLETLLKGNGYAVQMGKNGAQALAVARANPPAMIISDILMPVMDGFTLCRHWRADPALKAIPFVFYTATYTDPQDEALALELGADMFIIKPQEPAEFMQIIQGLLNKQYSGTLKQSPSAELPESAYLKGYNEALVRKLEAKLEQLEQANKELLRQDRSNKALLRELYHRTRNNLQMISSFLRLQARQANDARIDALVQNAEKRIKILSFVGQKLYETGNVSLVSMRDYLGEIIQMLEPDLGSPESRISLCLEIDHEQVLIDTAIPCAMIINELLANAVRHAFPHNRQGEICLSLHRVGQRELELCYQDNGIGVPPEFDWRSSATIGLPTIFAIVERQLKGTIDCQGNGGVQIRIRFADNLYDDRLSGERVSRDES